MTRRDADEPWADEIDLRALVPDGGTVGFGGLGPSRKPVALAQALADSGARELRVVSFLGNIEGAGPRRLVTPLAVLDHSPDQGWLLVSVSPGVAPSEIAPLTGFPVRVGGPVAATPAPSAEEFAVLAEVDPAGLRGLDYLPGPEAAELIAKVTEEERIRAGSLIGSLIGSLLGRCWVSVESRDLVEEDGGWERTG
jgi:hypothetical protein